MHLKPVSEHESIGSSKFSFFQLIKFAEFLFSYLRNSYGESIA